MSRPNWNISKYHIKEGRKILHAGITDNLEEIKAVHEQGKRKVRPIGHTTLEAALKWQDDQWLVGRYLCPSALTPGSSRHMYKYHLKEGPKIVCSGITDNIERAKITHEKGRKKVRKIGNCTTFEAALKWLEHERCRKKRHLCLPGNSVSNRNVYKYYLKQGRVIIYAGITTDLKKREAQHQLALRKVKIKVKAHQVGNRTTREAAVAWEQEQKSKGIRIGSRSGIS